MTTACGRFLSHAHHFKQYLRESCAKRRNTPNALIQLKNTPFLIDSNEDYFPETLYIDPNFPKLIHFTLHEMQPFNVQSIGKEVQRLVDNELIEYGAIVIRGLPLTDGKTFSQLLHATNLKLSKYVGGVTKRQEHDPMVYPASNENQLVCMDLHNDNPYWPLPPQQLFFYYEKVADEGGLNPLLDMNTYMHKIPAAIVDTFESLGVRYDNYYPDAKQKSLVFLSWQETFKTDDRRIVNEYLEKGNFKFEWEQEESGETKYYHLRKWNIISPFKTHPVTGTKTWMNQIVAMHASYFHNHPDFPHLANISYSNSADEDRKQMQSRYPFNILYGDGSAVPYSVIQQLRKLAWQNAKGFIAKDGDLLIVDNYRTQHGRMGYKGERKLWIGISLGDKKDRT